MGVTAAVTKRACTVMFVEQDAVLNFLLLCRWRARSIGCYILGWCRDHGRRIYRSGRCHRARAARAVECMVPPSTWQIRHHANPVP